MADTIRGDGLVRTDRALAALVEDAERLDRARRRFSESPPSYRSHLSHNSTRSQSPNPPSEEQQRREERKCQLKREHRASAPHEQFKAQTSEERERIIEMSDTRIRYVPRIEFSTLARRTVKERWIEQGIWNNKWNRQTGLERPGGKWKHEGPLEPESESETDSEAEVEAPLFPLRPARAEAKPRRPKSDEELRRIAERRPTREREREASRPFYQFVYQVSKEREWIQDVLNAAKPFVIYDSNLHTHTAIQALARSGWPYNESGVRTNIPDPPDINAMAYEMVKNTWMKRGIWNKKWGVLPGMSWKHEQPLEEMLREEMGDDDAAPVQANGLEGNRHGTGEAPPRSIFDPRAIFGSLPPAESNHEASGILDASQQEPRAVTTLESGGHGTGGGPPSRNPSRRTSPAESSYGPVSNGLNASLQEPPAATDPPGLPNGDANYSSAVSSSRRRQAESRETSRSPLRQTRRRGERGLSVHGGQPPRIERNALGPVHPSKVSKAHKKSGPASRRQPKVSESLSDAPQALPGLDIAVALPEAAAAAPSRRSKRLQEAERKPDADRGGSQSRLRRSRTSLKSADSAKPQGVPKMRSGTARRRAR